MKIKILIISVLICNVMNAQGLSPYIRNFQNSHKILYTKGHAKSKGLDIALKYPATWHLKEGRRPHVVYLLTDTINDTGLFSITIKDVPEEFKKLLKQTDKEDFKDVINLFYASICNSISETGGYNRVYSKECEGTQIEGLDAFTISYYADTERAHMKITTYNVHHLVYYDFKLISLLFMFYLPECENQVSADIFSNIIFNTLVINNLWN